MAEAWPLLLSERETAKFTSYSIARMRKLVAAGLFPAHREHGGEKRWHRQEVENYFADVFGLDNGTKLSDQAVHRAMEAVHAHQPKVRRQKNRER